MTHLVRRLRAHRGGVRRTTNGLTDATLERFAPESAALRWVLTQMLAAPRAEESEATLVAQCRRWWAPLYSDDHVAPYVPLAARGPWIGTRHGAVVYDAGGYGMLGWGHNPHWATAALEQPRVMANAMTPQLEQAEFATALQSAIGHGADSPSEAAAYTSFVALNSGSEAMGLALRVAAARRDPTRLPMVMRLEGSFHGRTDGPARLSASSDAAYARALPGWSKDAPWDVVTLRPNDVEGAVATFERLDPQRTQLLAVCAEPVMGEGAPGLALTRPFYDALRTGSNQAGAALIIDSVQAGIRATGHLSIVDYDPMRGCTPPDMEVFSKAISGGQFPLSVLALSAHTPWPSGIYGNTMTANPRALAVGTMALDQVTPRLRRQIVEGGAALRQGLEGLRAAFPSRVVGVEGTGLLCALHLDQDVVDLPLAERRCREVGLNVIAGANHSLRFTPVFDLDQATVDGVIVPCLEQVLAEL